MRSNANGFFQQASLFSGLREDALNALAETVSPCKFQSISPVNVTMTAHFYSAL